MPQFEVCRIAIDFKGAAPVFFDVPLPPQLANHIRSHEITNVDFIWYAPDVEAGHRYTQTNDSRILIPAELNQQAGSKLDLGGFRGLKKNENI